MSGALERARRLQVHSAALHQWIGTPNPILVEHHVVVMLFCMDSAIECFTFMLNALGQAVDRTGFRDISTNKGLRGIGPCDINGAASNKPLRGYTRFFPTLQSYWQQEAQLIELITANHDVTKHRHSPATGWTSRDDPPPGYFEAMGLSGSSMANFLARLERSPLKVFHLNKRPRLPLDDPNPKEWITLEEIEEQFSPFIPKSFCLAYEDAVANIVLPDSSLHH